MDKNKNAAETCLRPNLLCISDRSTFCCKDFLDSCCFRGNSTTSRRCTSRFLHIIHHQLARTRSSAIAERPTRRSVLVVRCCSTIVCIMRSYRVSVGAAISAIATFYSATCIVLYMHHCSKLSYHTACMRCSVSHT